MSASKSTFLRGGLHVDCDFKSLTAGQSIESFQPVEVVIPMSQHLGKAATPIVKRKTVVKRGDLIAVSDENGAPVHASISGTVSRIALQPHPILAESEAVVIEADPAAGEPEWKEHPNWLDQDENALLEQIATAGIVGLGGAAFPTHRKLRLPEGIKIDTLIINGAECEPYLTSDHRLMLESPRSILWGATLIAKILSAKKIIIGIEDNKRNAIEMLESKMAQGHFPIPIQVKSCDTRYPQGSEKQLIETVSGRVVPPRKLPMHVGIMVQNVATATAVYEAIAFRHPLLDRIITLSGSGIRTPKNLRVPIGTSIGHIVAHCGGLYPDTVKVIVGGPMMGRALGRLDVPVIKAVGGLIFLRNHEVRRDHYGPCISCGRCLDVCPLGLEPNQISMYTEAGRALESERYGTKECFECGCCSFACPAGRPLVQFIQIAKSAFKTRSALGIAVRPGGPHE